MAIVLCKCEGLNGKGDGMYQVRDVLRRQGERVLWGEVLCKHGIEPVLKNIGKPEPIVIGGCWCEDQRDEFRAALRRQGFDPFALRFVPLLGERSPETAARMLHAAAERMRQYTGARPDNLRPRFGRTDGKMSRRHFLRYPRVRYDVIPAIDPDRCRSRERSCRLCQRKCSSGALVVNDEGSMSVIKEKCTGCGICVTGCPPKAIRYPGYDQREVLREIDVLLAGCRGAAAKPRAILFVCEESDLVHNDYYLTGGTVPEGVLPVIVPCLGMVPPLYMLYPLSRGAVKVGMLSCPGRRCRKSSAVKSLIDDCELTAILLAKLGAGKERLEIISASSPAHLDKELDAFGQSVLEMVPTARLGRRSGNPPDGEDLNLRQLLEQQDLSSFRITGLGAIPYGLVQAGDPSNCTFCGVCEQRCPAEALEVVKGASGRELNFRYGDCVACGACVRSCSERVLSMSRELDAGKLAAKQGTVLAAERQVTCSRCGEPFLNEALSRKFRRELQAGEAEYVTRLCNQCRINAALSSILVQSGSPDIDSKQSAGIEDAEDIMRKRGDPHEQGSERQRGGAKAKEDENSSLADGGCRCDPAVHRHWSGGAVGKDQRV